MGCLGHRSRLRGRRHSNWPRQLPHGKPAMDCRGNDCQPSLRQSNEDGQKWGGEHLNAALAALMCDFDGHRASTHGDVSAKAPPCGSAIACQFLVWRQKTAILGVGCRRFLADGPELNGKKKSQILVSAAKRRAPENAVFQGLSVDPRLDRPSGYPPKSKRLPTLSSVSTRCA